MYSLNSHRTKSASKGQPYRRHAPLFGLVIATLFIFIPVATTQAAYLIEIDTDGADDGVLTFNSDFAFGGDTTTAAQSVTSTAYGTTGGDSIFGGNGSNEPDTYVFTYTPADDADNLDIPPGTPLSPGRTAKGYPGGMPGVYRIWATWNFTQNVSGGLTHFTISTANAADVNVDIDQNDGGAGSGNEWIYLGEIEYSDEQSQIAVTQSATSNTFVSTRSYGVLIERKDSPPVFDFGDAPVPYPTLLADDGARHDNPGVLLGGGRDGEFDGHPSANADGDDKSGIDDETGINFEGALIACTSVQVRVNINGLGNDQTAPLNAWVDFNVDGDWEDAGEQIFTDEPVSNGDNNLHIDVPCFVTTGTSFARFRISNTFRLPPHGEAPDGEVEDYPVRLQDPPDGVFKDSFESGIQ